MKRKTAILKFFIFLLLNPISISYSQNYEKIDSLKQIIYTLPELNDTEADTTRMKLVIDIGRMYEQTRPDTAIYWYSSIADTLFIVDRINEHPRRSELNALALENIGITYNMHRNYSAAYKYFNYALTLFEALNDKAKLASVLNSLGSVTMRMGNYPKSIYYSEKALTIFEELEDTIGKASSYLGLGNAYFSRGAFPDAAKYYESALEIFEEQGNIHGISRCVNNLGSVATYQGRYREAKKYFEQALKIRQELGDIRGIPNTLLNLGTIANYQGNFPDAIKYYEEALKIREQIGDIAGTSTILNNMGAVLRNQGNYQEAIRYLERALEITEQTGDKRTSADCLVNLAIVFWYQNDFSKAINYFERSLQISEEIGDTRGISRSLNNLGLVATHNEDYEKAIYYLEISLNNFKELEDNKGISYCLMGLGSVESARGNYSEAISYYERSLELLEELGEKARLAKEYPLIAQTYMKVGEIDKGLELLINSKNITLTLLQENFAILSEQDKELYLEQTRSIFNDIHSFNINYPDHISDIAGICYNNELILKGLLLKSTAAILDVVYGSPDPEVKDTYYHLKHYRDQILRLQGSEAEDRDERIAEIEIKANELERKLVRLSSDFAELQMLFEYNWQDVQKQLSHNEAAIEFISFTSGAGDEKTVYAALILTPESKQPNSVRLFDEQELQKILGDDVSTGYDYVNSLYSVEHRELYRLIWQPMSPYLEGITRVYYAPVGVLNKIAFAALAEKPGNMLCDKYDLFQLSTTGKLLEESGLLFPDEMLAAVYGGINYNPKDVEVEQWKYLPGSLIEKKAIRKMLNNNNINVLSFYGDNASEESIKGLYYDVDNQPHLLHIATHGFFYPDPEIAFSRAVIERGVVDFRGSEGFGNWMFVNNKNPMMRSGLVFAGANRVWHEDWGRTDNDGVLTAFEVSNMNMRNTQLVVLSACETGLGDIRGSEGVYGLQRAFKMAGVNNIIMSLWQVPDKETVEFMEIFYTKLLDYRDVRTAFNETQRQMRQKYDPFYWAAFVLVE